MARTLVRTVLLAWLLAGCSSVRTWIWEPEAEPMPTSAPEPMTAAPDPDRSPYHDAWSDAYEAAVESVRARSTR